MQNTEDIRNIAIIAHVDHGKTTLVDGIFKQSGLFHENKVMEERVLDSNPLEKERGITILSKNTAIPYKDKKINILDTPGHSDFGGEVERVLNMVDGALLIVDAVEGPMPQTRFVLKQALERNLKILVVINKIDRPAAQPDVVIDKTFDLFVELGANEQQLDFPVLYAIGLEGKAGYEPDQLEDSLTPLLDSILKQVPAPTGDINKPLQLQVSTLDYNEYLGRILIGRITQGKISLGQNILLAQADKKNTKSKISKLFTFEGLEKIETTEAIAGDIVAVAGISEAQIGDSIVDENDPQPLTRIKVEEPTLEMKFSINSSPFAGTEGEFVTSRHLKDRLERETKTNISLRVTPTETAETFLVAGRGELHLGILIETMRREGYEFEISKPQVLQKEIDGQTCEPFEIVAIDVPEEATGSCIEALGKRKAEMINMHSHAGRTIAEFMIPSRFLLGFHSYFIKLTKGNGIITSAFEKYAPVVAEDIRPANGSLVAHEDGTATEYSLKNLEDRGIFFVQPGTKIYKGMIIGKNSKNNDLKVNVCKAKKLTNMRSAGADVLNRLMGVIDVTLEYAMDYISGDDLVEITPQNIRLRKLDLNAK